jgi:hypothetical protein
MRSSTWGYDQSVLEGRRMRRRGEEREEAGGRRCQLINNLRSPSLN